jgi:PAS domain S-box-containing protein
VEAVKISGNRFLGFTLDTTDLREAELALRQSESKFRDVLENSRELLYKFNIKSGSFEYVSPSVLEIQGITVDEYSKGGIELAVSLVHPDDRERIKEQLYCFPTEYSADNILPVVEYRSKCPDGSYRWFSDSRKIVFDKAGIAVSVVGNIRDISEFKQTMEDLQGSENRFNSLIQSASDGIIVCEEDGLITLWNSGAEKIFGYKSTQIIGQPLSILIPPKYSNLHSGGFNKLISDGIAKYQGQTLEVEGLRKDGSIFPLELSISFWQTQDKIHVTAIMRDSSARKKAEAGKAKLEEQLRRAQKLETIGTLAGGIAHDFNNILAPIMGYTEIALMSLNRADPIYEDLEHVLKGTNRAKDLVEQILLFSKQSEKERQPLALPSLVKEALKLLRPSIPASVEIQQRIDTNCGKIMADATQIHQVIVNLCSNAWQAMSTNGGTLSIELSQRKVNPATAKLHHALREREYACLSVIDTGDGMEEYTLSRIFEPFFTTKDVDKGTGLGLSVVHGIVHSHKGEILVYSERGKGTSFHVYLPIINSLKPIIEDTPTEISTGSEFVMIVDDEPIISEMVRRILERYGYKTEIYNSGLAALKAFKSQPDKYDMLISDLTMPQMSGLDLADQTHKINSKIPVMIMTGFGDSLTSATQKKYHIKKVLSKPVAVKELADAVRNVLDMK